MVKKEFVKKPFLFAGISVVIFISFLFLSGYSSSLGFINLSSIFSAISLTSGIFVFVGYYNLGKRNKSVFLMRVIISGFVLFVLFFILGSYYSPKFEKSVIEINQSLSEKQLELENLTRLNATQEEIETVELETLSYLKDSFLPVILLAFLVYFIFALYTTFFGIALIRLKKVKYSKALGVSAIISVWLAMTVIGLLVAIPLAFASCVISAILFFDQAKRFKEIQ